MAAADDALYALAVQVAEVLGVLEGAALRGDGDGVQRHDSARAQRRLLVDLDLDGPVAESDLVRQFADYRRDLDGVVFDEVELLG